MLFICYTGLTCTEQNFITKSGFQQFAAQHGIIVVAPDTSPRMSPSLLIWFSTWHLWFTYYRWTLSFICFCGDSFISHQHSLQCMQSAILLRQIHPTVQLPRVGSGVVRIEPLRFLARCH